MNYKRLLFSMALCALLFSACNKDHYNLSEVQGVQMEGEILMPLASASYSVTDLMQRLELDNMVSFDGSGNMGIDYSYDIDDVLNGAEILRLHDESYEEHFSYSNPVPIFLPVPIDTVIRYNHVISLESEYLRVYSALLKSGRISFNFESNSLEINKVIIRASEIKDAQGESVVLTYLPGGSNSFDLSGLNYESQENNVLNLSYEFYIRLQGTIGSELTFDIQAMVTDMAFERMSGWVDSYTYGGVIDTAFSLFSDNLLGELGINGVEVAVDIMNGFDMPARLVIDTALIYSEGTAPSPLFEEMPQIIDIHPTHGYEEVFNQDMSAALNVQGGRAYASLNFILNPEGLTEMVSMVDTSTLDIRVNGRFPFAFTANDVRYFDTIDMGFSQIESPEWIEKLTLEMLFNSSIPFNIGGDLLLYNTETHQVVDTLLSDPNLFQSTFDGSMCSSTVALDIDDERISKIIEANKLILCLDVDTDSHNAVINADQKMEIFLKARVKYNGNVEFNNNEQ